MKSVVNSSTDIKKLTTILRGNWGLENNVVYLGPLALTMVNPKDANGDLNAWTEVVENKLWMKINNTAKSYQPGE